LDPKLVREIHSRTGKFVVAITGGGVSALSELLKVPGASNTLLSAFIPYHAEELSHFIGSHPDQSCSSQTARSLAMAAYQRAIKIEGDEPVFGLGCTAALATNRERRGDDRCYIAIQSSTFTTEISVVFDKDQRTRSEEEGLCASLLLGFMANILGMDNDATGELRTTDDFSRKMVKAEESWQSLLAGNTKTTEAGNSNGLVFPGAFNPLHQGHLNMIRYAEELNGRQVTLEISVFNVDKPPLDFIEMHLRQDALGNRPLIFTHAPTFLEKCRIFPGTTFLVGSDTMSRIAEPQYYNASTDQRDSALIEIAEAGSKFLVFGRSSDNEFVTLDDLQLPETLTAICIKVPENEYRVDISSTEIRTNLQ